MTPLTSNDQKNDLPALTKVIRVYTSANGLKQETEFLAAKKSNGYVRLVAKNAFVVHDIDFDARDTKWFIA